VRPILVLEPCNGDPPAALARLVQVELGLDSPSYLDLGVSLAGDASLATDFHLSGRMGDSLLWHPCQLWEFHRLAQLVRIDLTISNVLFGVESCTRTLELLASGLRDRLAEFADGEQRAQFHRMLALMLLAEPRVHTAIDPTVHTSPFIGETFSGYFEWLSNESDRDLLAVVGTAVDEVEGWHGEIALVAQLADPVRDFRVLLRHAARDRRKRLHNAALLANDLYDHAEILRRYLETYHNRTLLEEDDVIHGPQGPVVKHRLYGARRTADFDRSVFRQILRSFDLDAQARMLWFVEGDTEEGFVRRFAERTHLDLLRAGIDLMNLNGLGGLASDRFRALLERLQREEVFPYVTVDREQQNDHLRLLQHYARQGLLPAGFRVWDPDFESGNFSVAELLAVANRVAEAAGVEGSLTEQGVLNEMAIRQWPIGRAIQQQWGRISVPGGKGRAWGAALADWVDEHALRTGLDDESKLRPIESVVRLLLRAQWSDYRFTVEDSEVDSMGQVVPRASALPSF
jgi:hypothetical protein